MTSGASTEKGLRPALDGKIHNWTKRPLTSARKLHGLNPTWVRELLVSPCPPRPARTATMKDTLHFFEKGALELQHTTAPLRDREQAFNITGLQGCRESMAG